jgi:4'-phosphopantetheinyl transferase
MDQSKIAVHPWPASRPLIAATPEAGLDLLVISVATADGTPRHAARTQLQSALREVLSLQFQCKPELIGLLSTPGQAIRVDLPGHRIGLSASHEPGISVAAIHRHGPVGIDILRLTQKFEWQRVAQDYLGLQIQTRIACMPQQEQLPEFAREWTRLEARLKCIGVGLQEWSLPLERQISACHLVELELPTGLFGAIACERSWT